MLLVVAVVLLALAGSAGAQPAPNAQPTGGVVVGGAATISQSATTTTVAQSSQRAAINWQSLDLGAHQTLTLRQPSASAVALLRVIGPNPSQIAGRIAANGQVIITDAAGVVVYRGAAVDSAGVVLSAPGVTTQNFMAGNIVLDQPPTAGATVANAAQITVKQAGLAALVAPFVVNSGVIQARLGHVVLLGALAASLDVNGSGPVVFGTVGQVLSDPGGSPLVDQVGQVVANGGTVQFEGDAVAAVAPTIVSDSGKVVTNTLGGASGEIVLDGTGGAIDVTGRLNALGAAPAATGGQIELLADSTSTVSLGATAVVDASGPAGGGTIALGTTVARARGGPGVTGPVSGTVSVAPAALVKANATKNGNGGRLCVLSGTLTAFNGSGEAKGGPSGGNGGLIEISSVGTVDLSGSTLDVGAPAGTTGAILLDPRRLIL